MTGDVLSVTVRVSRYPDDEENARALRHARRDALAQLCEAMLEHHGLTDFRVSWDNDTYVQTFPSSLVDLLGGRARRSRLATLIPDWDTLELRACAYPLEGGVE